MPQLPGVKTGEFLPFYLFVSEESLLVSRSLAELKDAAIPVSTRGFNLETMTGRGLSGQSVVAMAQTLPMMAARRMTVIENINLAQAAELKGILAYLENPNPSTVIVATATKIDKRIKFFSALKKKGWLFELKAPRRAEDWIRSEAKAAGATISGGAQRRLADVVGVDLARLTMAIEQLSLYAGEGEVQASHVDELIANTREQTVFQLIEALDGGDLKEILKISDSIFGARQSAIGVLVLIARHVRQIAVYHAAVESGEPRSELAKLLGVPPFVVDKVQRASRIYGPAAAAEMASILAKVDVALKGGSQATRVLGRGLSERVLVEDMLIKFVRLGRRRA